MRLFSTILPIASLVGLCGCTSCTNHDHANGGNVGLSSYVKPGCSGAPGNFSMFGSEGRMIAKEPSPSLREVAAAIGCKDARRVKGLLMSDVDPKAVIAGEKLTYWAALAGDKEVLDVLIEAGASIDGDEGTHIKSPLSGSVSHAINTGDWSVYEYLIKRGANVKIRSGNPTLTIAGELVMIGQFGRVNELLDHGYDRDLPELSYWVNTSNPPQDGQELKEYVKLKNRLSTGAGSH